MAARAVEVRRRKTGTAAALVSAGGRGRTSGWAELAGRWVERLGLLGKVGRSEGVGWLGPAGRPRPGEGQAGWAEKSCRAARSAGPKARKRISELKLDF
jgi:hypothetical protein